MEAIEAFFEGKLADSLLLVNGEKPMFVCDCIDNVDTKVELLAYCRKNSIRVISAFGAGGHMDPTKIRIADLADIIADPLGRAVRRGLASLGIRNGILCCYVTNPDHKSRQGLLPLTDEDRKELEKQAGL